jgi:23S rRNA (cytosine1962-C5)-methyltransferase
MDLSHPSADKIGKYLSAALKARHTSQDQDIAAALRLFNGFYEGCPELVIDRYAGTLVLYGYGEHPDQVSSFLEQVEVFLRPRLARVTCVVHKMRASNDLAQRRGLVRFGDEPDQQIREHGVIYAIDLQMNQDASFYLDTRHLRRWLLGKSGGWRVLNTFAYTGSLGVAALAGGAARVVQVDRSRKFLELARRSAMLNHLDLGKMKLDAVDFFSRVAYYKRRGELFDCVILDPPFFSATKKGVVDLVAESVRLINKVRPLVIDGGWLVTINNALFLSGAEYMRSLEALCRDGYLSIDHLIPVPQDITGYPETIVNSPPSDPAPFNHPTKIAVMRVRRR